MQRLRNHGRRSRMTHVAQIERDLSQIDVELLLWAPQNERTSYNARLPRPSDFIVLSPEKFAPQPPVVDGHPPPPQPEDLLPRRWKVPVISTQVIIITRDHF